MTLSLGKLSATQQVGSEIHSHFQLVDVPTFSGEDGVAVVWGGDAVPWFPPALAALAFIAVSRIWRVFWHRPDQPTCRGRHETFRTATKDEAFELMQVHLHGSPASLPIGNGDVETRVGPSIRRIGPGVLRLLL